MHVLPSIRFIEITAAATVLIGLPPALARAEAASKATHSLQAVAEMAEVAQPENPQDSTAAEPGSSPEQKSAPNSGVYGWLAIARGNLPANPASYECVKVFDIGGTKLLAKGECAGPWASFRVPLQPGTYMVEAGGKYVTAKGKVRLVPNRYTVEVKAGQWIKISRPSPKHPVP